MDDWNGEIYFIGIEKCNKIFKKSCLDSVKEFSFTPNEIDVIMFLVNNPTLDTARDISHYKNRSKALVCRSVESLVQRGMIVKKIDKHDRRNIHLCLTDKTIKIAERIKDCRKNFFKQLTTELSPEQIKIFQEVILKMLDNIDKMYLEEDL